MNALSLNSMMTVHFDASKEKTFSESDASPFETSSMVAEKETGKDGTKVISYRKIFDVVIA